MSVPAFEEPRLAINRVYTRRGDAGQTSLAGGQRPPKNDLRIEAYGTVDELNSFIGLARESARELPELDRILRRVQHELFNLGSILATLPEDVHPKQARITAAESEQLEREIEAMAAQMQQPVEEVRKRLTEDNAVERLRDRMRSEKALNLLYSNSN